MILCAFGKFKVQRRKLKSKVRAVHYIGIARDSGTIIA
jgi:hypothetical protein